MWTRGSTGSAESINRLTYQPEDMSEWEESIPETRDDSEGRLERNVGDTDTDHGISEEGQRPRWKFATLFAGIKSGFIPRIGIALRRGLRMAPAVRPYTGVNTTSTQNSQKVSRPFLATPANHPWTRLEDDCHEKNLTSSEFQVSNLPKCTVQSSHVRTTSDPTLTNATSVPIPPPTNLTSPTSLFSRLFRRIRPTRGSPEELAALFEEVESLEAALRTLNVNNQGEVGTAGDRMYERRDGGDAHGTVSQVSCKSDRPPTYTTEPGSVTTRNGL